MSLIEKSIDSILEQESSIKLPVGDIGDEFAEMYKNLDLSTKEKIDKLDNVQFKRDVLRNASNPKIKAHYDKMGKKGKAQLDALPIRDKFLMLKNAVKAKEKKKKRKPMSHCKRRPKNPKVRLLIRLIFLRHNFHLIRLIFLRHNFHLIRLIILRPRFQIQNQIIKVYLKGY